MDDIRVEVIYAEPDREVSIELVLPAGSTVAVALARVASERAFAEFDLERMSVGIFGRVVTDRSQRLDDGDRVEIYRPLRVDPVTARRLRASRRAD